MKIPKGVLAILPIVCSDEARYNLCGVHLVKSGNDCRAEATDGKKLIRVEWKHSIEPERVKVKRGGLKQRRVIELAKQVKAAAAEKPEPPDMDAIIPRRGFMLLSRLMGGLKTSRSVDIPAEINIEVGEPVMGNTVETRTAILSATKEWSRGMATKVCENVIDGNFPIVERIIPACNIVTQSQVETKNAFAEI